MRVISPVPGGSGVEVLHRSLADGIGGYRLECYSPWWTLFPPALAGFSSSRADLIHASSDYGLFFKRPGMPLIVTVHNHVCDSFMRGYSTPLQYLHYRTDLRWFSRMTLSRATVVVAISRFIDDLVRRDLGVDPPMRTIYNGVDHARFVPSESRSAGGRFRILFCGNLNRRKRAHLLPQLANALDERFEIQYTVGLAGKGSLLGGVQKGAARLVDLGSVRHSDMPAVYRGVDALFMPSVREGFGLCVAEAMACGLPIVACKESALPELVDSGQGGMLCPVDDIGCYATAIRQLADDYLVARRMGQFNRSRVEQDFTLERMVREYRELFEAVLDRADSF